MKNINVDNIKVSSKLDDVIKSAINEGYDEVNMKQSKKVYSNRNRKAVMAATVAIALGATVFGTGFGHRVVATAKLAMFDIGNYLGINKELDDYKTVVNTAVSQNGITVQLNEVILDNDELIVAVTTKSQEKLDEISHINLMGDVYLNGKRMTEGASGSSNKIDEYTEEHIMTYDMNSELPKGEIKLELNYVRAYFFGVDEVEVKGPWKFEFKANGDALASKTDTIKLNNSFILENGQKNTLTEYKSNDISDKIYYSIENKSKAYNFILKGHDDLGNEIEFYSSVEKKKSGLMKSINKISEEAKTLTLTPYTVAFPEESGRLDNDYKQVGETITIDLK